MTQEKLSPPVSMTAADRLLSASSLTATLTVILAIVVLPANVVAGSAAGTALGSGPVLLRSTPKGTTTEPLEPNIAVIAATDGTPDGATTVSRRIDAANTGADERAIIQL